MSKVKIFTILHKGMIADIAFRDEDQAIEYCKEDTQLSYHPTNLMPKKKKAELQIRLNIKYPTPYQILKNVKPLFPDDTIMGMTSKQGEEWLKTINDLNRLDGHSFETVEMVIIWWRNNEFWSDTKTSILCLRQTNKDKQKYFIVFKQKMENEKRFTGSNKDRQIAESAGEIANFASGNFKE